MNDCKCAMCGCDVRPLTPEAMEEYKTLYPDAHARGEPIDQICDDCFEKTHPHRLPEFHAKIEAKRKAELN